MMINKDLLLYVRMLIVGLVVVFGALTIIASTENQPIPNYIWVKPNSTDQDFKKDSYVCLKESQQRVSEYSREGRSASSSSTVQTNDSLYNACMQSRGWTLEREVPADKKKVKNASKKRKRAESDQVIDGNKNDNMSPVVENLKVSQSGDKAVATYDLVGQNREEAADVTVAIIINGKRRTAETLHLTGDFGKRVKVGLGKKVIWNALADLPSNFDGELSWDVTAASIEPVSQMKKKKAAKKPKKGTKKAEPASD